MLRCSTPEVFSDGSSSEMSVLERQKAMMQRLCFNQQEIPHHQAGLNLFQYQNMIDSQKLNQSLDDISPNFGFACSGIAAGFVELEQNQRSFSTVSANSSKDHRMAPARKRKAQVFDAEAESKNKMIEGEVESCVTVKIEKENSCKTSKANSKASESAPKTDYIHVRARRGQATDSHSLAERARREKITKKMKCLQELVPGCNKVIGKAGMLDEIINYVQSLQKQVEFLSMKLAALNPRMDFNMENFFMKELSAYIASFPSTAATATMPIELMNSSFLQYNQGPQVSANNDLALNATQLMSQKAVTSSIPYPETYMDSIPNLQQVQQISESDWQSIYNLSFH